METSQHNPYESGSQGSMNVNEVAMPQYKPPEVTMLQWKIKVQRQLEGYVSIRAISEATVSQNGPSSQKSTINE